MPAVAGDAEINAAEYVERLSSYLDYLVATSSPISGDPVFLAELAVQADRPDLVYDYLWRSVRARESRLVYVMVDPLFADYRKQSAFAEIKSAMDFSESRGPGGE